MPLNGRRSQPYGLPGLDCGHIPLELHDNKIMRRLVKDIRFLQGSFKQRPEYGPAVYQVMAPHTSGALGEIMAVSPFAVIKSLSDRGFYKGVCDYDTDFINTGFGMQSLIYIVIAGPEPRIFASLARLRAPRVNHMQDIDIQFARDSA